MALNREQIHNQFSNGYPPPQNSGVFLALGNDVGSSWYTASPGLPGRNPEVCALDIVTSIPVQNQTGALPCNIDNITSVPYSTSANSVINQIFCQQNVVQSNTDTVPWSTSSDISQLNQRISEQISTQNRSIGAVATQVTRDGPSDDVIRCHPQVNDFNRVGGGTESNCLQQGGGKVDAPVSHLQFQETECLECGRFFISAKHYKAHLEYHANEKLNRSKEFTQYKANDKLGGFDCLECGRHYSRKDHVKRHLKSHEKQRAKEEVTANVCMGCGKSFKRLDQLRRHEKCHKTRKKARADSAATTGYSCAECGKTYKRKYHLERHAESHESHKSQVDFAASCKSNVKTESEADFVAGERESETDFVSDVSRAEIETGFVTGVGETETETNFVAGVDQAEAWEADTDVEESEHDASGSESLRVDEVAVYAEMEANSNDCESQSENVINSDMLEVTTSPQTVEGSRNPEQLVSCEMEEKVAINAEKLCEATLNSIVMPESRGKYGCQECGKHFERMYRLRRHQLGHDARRRKEELRRAQMAEEEDDPESRLKARKHKLVDVNCRVCNRHFTRADHLKRHEMIHLPGRIRAKCNPSTARVLPFKCEKCRRTFSKAEFLEKHRDTHLKKCEFCAQRFLTMIDLKEHMVVHKGEMPNICHVCGKLFHLRKQLQKHKDVHRPHDPSFQPFVCQECGFTCRSKKILQRHQADHYGRQFMCQVCGKAFKVRVDLTKHCIIHFGTKNHKCPICGKGFFVAKDLRRHIKIHRR